MTIEGTQADREGASGEPELLCFDGFELDTRTGELRQGKERRSLQPQPALVLRLLAERAGELVSRDELRRRVWGEDAAVDSEHGLNYCVLQVRRALEDDAERPLYVETIPRRGYRFLRPVIRKPAEGRPAGRGGRRPARQLVVAGVLALATIVTGVFLAVGDEPGPRRPSLAVGPIAPEDDTVREAAAQLTEELVGQLVVRLGGRAIVTAGGGVQTDGPDFVLDGAIRSLGETTEVSVRLIRVSTGATLWSGVFEATTGVGARSQCAERIAEAVSPRFETLRR